MFKKRLKINVNLPVVCKYEHTNIKDRTKKFNVYEKRKIRYSEITIKRNSILKKKDLI